MINLILIIQLSLPKQCVRGASWSAANHLLRQQIGAISWRPMLRPTNSGSTLPRPAHLDGDMIEWHQGITSHSGCAPAYLDKRPTPWFRPACIPCTTSIPAPTQLTMAMTNYTHAPTVTKSSVRMEVASSRPDHLPTLSIAIASKLSLLVKHNILAMDEAS